MINLQYPSANTVIDSTEFRTTLNAKHLAQLQYSAFQYNDCLGTRSKASTLSTKKKIIFSPSVMITQRKRLSNFRTIATILKQNKQFIQLWKMFK